MNVRNEFFPHDLFTRKSELTEGCCAKENKTEQSQPEQSTVHQLSILVVQRLTQSLIGHVSDIINFRIANIYNLVLRLTHKVWSKQSLDSTQ
jgi:hypothetical protein